MPKIRNRGGIPDKDQARHYGSSDATTRGFQGFPDVPLNSRVSINGGLTTSPQTMLMLYNLAPLLHSSSSGSSICGPTAGPERRLPTVHLATTLS